MPVAINLIEDGYVIHYEFTEPFLIEELLTAYQQELAFRNAAPHTLHSLTDFSKVTGIPKNWLQARSGPGLKHPRSGEMIFVGVRPGLKILLNTILKITRYERIKLFDTPEAAMAYAHQLAEETKKQTAAVAAQE